MVKINGIKMEHGIRNNEDLKVVRSALDQINERKFIIQAVKKLVTDDEEFNEGLNNLLKELFGELSGE